MAMSNNIQASDDDLASPVPFFTPYYLISSLVGNSVFGSDSAFADDRADSGGFRGIPPDSDFLNRNPLELKMSQSLL